jgi:hypothetical protein
MRNMTKARDRVLALVTAEAVLVEAALAGLTPLLLRSGSATTVATSTTGLHLLRLHLLRLHLLVVHARTPEAGLLLGKGLSAGAGSCPRIRL